MSDAEDRELVEKCCGGDREAFTELVDRYQKTVFNTALRIVGDPEEAEDVAQSAFLKAYEKLDSYRPQFRFFSWIYRITVNESLNVLRYKKHFQRLEEGEAVTEAPAVEVDQTDRIQDALMGLKLDHRVVVILKHLQGLSYEEIATVLEISPTKVKSRLFTARNILKVNLKRQGFGDD
ncbi:MAG: RNA polymerase sigma factor [Bacteroidota bacterium]